MEFRITWNGWNCKTGEETAKQIAQVCSEDAICEVWENGKMLERLLLLDIFNRE